MTEKDARSHSNGEDSCTGKKHIRENELFPNQFISGPPSRRCHPHWGSDHSKFFSGYACTDLPRPKSQLIPDLVMVTVKINDHECSIQNMKWSWPKRTRCSAILLFLYNNYIWKLRRVTYYFLFICILVNNWWLYGCKSDKIFLSDIIFTLYGNMESIWYLKDVQETRQCLLLRNMLSTISFSLFENLIL